MGPDQRARFDSVFFLYPRGSLDDGLLPELEARTTFIESKEKIPLQAYLLRHSYS